MSAPSVDFDKEYRFRDGVTRLDAAELNARFLSMHARLRALEAISFTFEALAIEIGNLGIQRINALILPLIEQAQADLATIVEASEAALELLAQIQQSGLPAVNITLAPIPDLTAETVQAGLAELASSLDAALTATSEALAAEAAARTVAIAAETAARNEAVNKNRPRYATVQKLM